MAKAKQHPATIELTFTTAIAGDGFSFNHGQSVQSDKLPFTETEIANLIAKGLLTKKDNQSLESHRDYTA